MFGPTQSSVQLSLVLFVFTTISINFLNVSTWRIQKCEAFTTSSSSTLKLFLVRNDFYSYSSYMKKSAPQQTLLKSSFYSDFEEFEFQENGDNNNEDNDEEDEDDEDDYIDLDATAIAKFRSQMDSDISIEEPYDDDDEEEEDDDDDEDESSDYKDEINQSASLSSISSIDDLISFATSSSSLSSKATPNTDWANPIDTTNDFSNTLKGGVVLLANPLKFCSDIKSSNANSNTNYKPSPALLAKFGLTLPPPGELGPDRRADLLPVLVLLERHPLRGCQGVLLNRRTGYLMGDLEQPPPPPSSTLSNKEDVPPPAPQLGAFMIQPLWFGGTSSGSGVGGDKTSATSNKGLDVIHKCPNVKGATQLTEDGLYWGGDLVQAQEVMNDPSLERIVTGFDFKFFVQSTRWLPMQLEKEIRDGTWFVASVSKEVLFKSRDRLGAKRAKPLWTEIMELMGGQYKDIRDMLYEE